MGGIGGREGFFLPLAPPRRIPFGYPGGETDEQNKCFLSVVDF